MFDNKRKNCFPGGISGRNHGPGVWTPGKAWEEDAFPGTLGAQRVPASLSQTRWSRLLLSEGREGREAFPAFLPCFRVVGGGTDRLEGMPCAHLGEQKTAALEKQQESKMVGDFPSGSAVKNPPQCRRRGFKPWVRKIPWR